LKRPRVFRARGAEPRPPPRKETDNMQDGKHLILCVDDDADFLDSLKLILEADGYRIEVARSAEEGLKRFKELSPDLVIADLMMEEIDSGTTFVKEIKSLGADVPVYMLSSVGDNLNITADYAELGLTGVLQKPINPSVLRSTLKAKLQ
jgi:DNA-binding response OmpR family regulator